MIPQFENLTAAERDLLYQAPALLSFWEACAQNNVNPVQKEDAIKLAHLKTFTAVPLLLPYYAEVEKRFTNQWEALEQEYLPLDETRRNKFLQQKQKVEKVIEKLDARYAQVLKESLQRFAKHVKRANHSVFQDFLFAFAIDGLNA